MKKSLPIITAFLLTLSHLVLAKRMGPAEIKPIVVKKGTIEHSFENNDKSFSTYIIMKDKSGDLRWKTKIYSRKYIPNLETDVQDIHLKSLYVKDTSVFATDESGQTYEVDIPTGDLVKPAKPHEHK